MVDKQGQARRSIAKRGRVQRVDWLAREMDYRSGLSPEDLAARYGVTPTTAAHWPYVRGWLAPMSSAEHREKLLTAEIAAAELALTQGDFTAAERRMRAAMAIEKAVRALADIKEDKPMKGADASYDENAIEADQPGESVPERGYRAELKRRLLRIVEAVEGKARSDGLVGDAERGGCETDS